MNLQTTLPKSKKQLTSIDYSSKVLLLGSCFSENIGKKLSYYKFEINQNPFGILFHPKAIENLILNAINEKKYTEADVFLHNERWHCFEAHSTLSRKTKNELITHLNSTIKNTNTFLKSASHIVITLGTSWVYRLISTDTFVANCHKIPQKKFLKELLSISEITESIDAITTLIKSINNSASIIFTVSPVRHLRDGFIENTLSKSHLISGIHEIIDPKKNSFYFPSYEIMMDELRDYRFYAEDMIHPSQTAINYIWNKFSDTWISDPAQKTMLDVATIQKGLSHKPFNENSEQHQLFLKNLELKIKQVKTKIPSIKF